VSLLQSLRSEAVRRDDQIAPAREKALEAPLD
jgi:hypothetical protein